MIGEFIKTLYNSRNPCQMCRRSYDSVLTLNRVITSDIDWQILVKYHRHCKFNNHGPVAKKYLSDIGENWIQLVDFMCSTKLNPTFYKDVQGIEGLNFSKHEVEGRLIDKGECYAIFKTAEGKTQICFCCLLPHMSLRLLIGTNDGCDIEEDNKYADEAVGFMNIQLTACWMIFAQLVNKDSIDHLLVRKFESVTCYLLLTGMHEFDLPLDCENLMKEQLGNLRKHNFNPSHFDRIRNTFPGLKRNNANPWDLDGFYMFGINNGESEDECEDEDDCSEENDDSYESEEDYTSVGNNECLNTVNEQKQCGQNDVVVKEGKLNFDIDDESSDEKVDEMDNEDTYYTRNYSPETMKRTLEILAEIEREKNFNVVKRRQKAKSKVNQESLLPI